MQLFPVRPEGDPDRRALAPHRPDARLNAPIVATLPGPTQVFVQCQKQGDTVTAEGHTNNWWSRLRDQGGYISNIYIDHPDAQLPGIPNC
ncbi:hypothetical protein ACQPXM_26375 [Kribbella sp. CA-253562]|uniref:hypothetical protein n=1 Tax=Kribbella sp. CA-253562 TaxID=3239942 RepID=UPI003D903070